MPGNMKIQNRYTLLLLTSALMAVLSAAAQPPSPKVVIGYCGGYRGLLNTDTIDVAKLTHINYAFVNLRNNRAMLEHPKTDTVNLRKLAALKTRNPHLQILISIGGWSWSENFSDAALTDTARRAFAHSAVAIIQRFNLDGVDIDWEYPGRPGEDGNVYRKEDKQNFTLLFQALRQSLDTLEKATGKHKLLTTATGGFADFLSTTEMDKAQQYLDYVNLMTYDFYNGKIAGHHTNLYTSDLYPSAHATENAVKAYLAAGVPASKLVVGIAFYGRTYQLVPGAQKGPGDSVVSQQYGKGYTFIKDSLTNQKGFTYHRDKKAKAPYLYNAATRQFMTYDDEWSVKEKCEYVKKQQLAGVMFWEYDADLKGYLLQTIHKHL